MFSTIFFFNELTYFESQCTCLLVNEEAWSPVLSEPWTWSTQKVLPPGLFPVPPSPSCKSRLLVQFDWIERDHTPFLMRREINWLVCWAHLTFKSFFWGHFCQSLFPSTGLLQVGCVHLPYQAAAPDLAFCLLLDSSHKELSLSKSPLLLQAREAQVL